eukprot:CAMPEP_0180699556 /NCGR_PEP_ID=MMETSP1038_2-20121128/4615_1 /TAXON_ID=632150 /ORGANISM="Azadinium spinosum, Strain 3D9" /LENGTH=186 /DNA_ID=CAMNT_0022731189 /DNA_START=209 /DNA_END=768 /DNA_ORIENTATION=-
MAGSGRSTGCKQRPLPHASGRKTLRKSHSVALRGLNVVVHASVKFSGPNQHETGGTSTRNLIGCPGLAAHVPKVSGVRKGNCTATTSTSALSKEASPVRAWMLPSALEMAMCTRKAVPDQVATAALQCCRCGLALQSGGEAGEPLLSTLRVDAPHARDTLIRVVDALYGIVVHGDAQQPAKVICHN